MTIWTFGWTYATVCSADVRGDHRTYALQIVQADVRGTTGHMLLFEYFLVNTCTYETVIEPLGKNHQMYAPWPDVRCFFGPINITLPFFIFHKFQMSPGYQSVFKVF
jgi:hypothetical protein